MSGNGEDCVYLDDQPQLCKYANQYPYLEQYNTLEGFKYPYSTVSLGDEGACLAALVVHSNQLLVLDARSGELVFEVSLLQSDLTPLLTDTSTDVGTICCVYLSLVEEYLPTRYLVDLWLVYSNGVDFSVLFLFEFCVKVNVGHSDKVASHLNSIELLVLPEDTFPFQVLFANSQYVTCNKLYVSRCILGMDIGGPVALWKPGKQSSTDYPCVVLVCNYSILYSKFDASNDASHLIIESMMEDLPFITSALFIVSTDYLFDGDPWYMIIGTIQGSIEWISMKEKKPKKIYQMNAAIKKLATSRKFLVGCDEMGNGIIIPMASLYLLSSLNKPVDERFLIFFSINGVVQALENMDDVTFLLLSSNVSGYRYLRIQATQHVEENNFPRFYCNWIALIGPSPAYVGWTLPPDYQGKVEERDMIYIAVDGSFLVVSSSVVSNHCIEIPFVASSYDGANDPSFHLFQQMDNRTRVQQRYERIFQNLLQEMGHFSSLLHWFDKMRKSQETGGGFHVSLKQVRRIHMEKSSLDSHSCDDEDDHQISHLYHITIEWTYQGMEHLSIPFSILVQWKNISPISDDTSMTSNTNNNKNSTGIVSGDDTEILYQHTFHYNQLTSGTRERMEIPIHKTNGLSIHFRIFLIVELENVGPVLSNIGYPIALELPCERNWLDVLDFCEPHHMFCSESSKKRNDTRGVTCRISNPYPNYFHSLLLPKEWNLTETDWFVPIKTPWNEWVVIMNRMETIVLQCSTSWSLAIFHSCLWKRVDHISSTTQTKQHSTTTSSSLEERWRDNKKIILHSLQQAQNELQQAEQRLEEMRRNDLSNMEDVFLPVLEAYRLWRGCCFAITSNKYMDNC